MLSLPCVNTFAAKNTSTEQFQNHFMRSHRHKGGAEGVLTLGYRVGRECHLLRPVSGLTEPYGLSGTVVWRRNLSAW